MPTRRGRWRHAEQRQGRPNQPSCKHPATQERATTPDWPFGQHEHTARRQHHQRWLGCGDAVRSGCLGLRTGRPTALTLSTCPHAPPGPNKDAESGRVWLTGGPRVLHDGGPKEEGNGDLGAPVVDSTWEWLRRISNGVVKLCARRIETLLKNNLQQRPFFRDGSKDNPLLQMERGNVASELPLEKYF
jgi:hypothetical protein